MHSNPSRNNIRGHYPGTRYPKNEALSNPFPDKASFTIKIIRNIAQGKANKEIADELCISVYSVATHRRNICSKLGIHSPAGLTIFAIINHLVDINEVKPL